MENNFKPKKLNKAELAVHLDKMRRKRFETDKKSVKKELIFLFVHLLALVVFFGYIGYTNSNPAWFLLSLFHAVYLILYFWSLIPLFFEVRKEAYTYMPPTEAISEPLPKPERPQYFIWVAIKKIGRGIGRFFVFLWICILTFTIVGAGISVFSRVDSPFEFLKALSLFLLLLLFSYYGIALPLHSDARQRAKKGIPDRIYKNKYINQFVRFTEYKGYNYAFFAMCVILAVGMIAHQLGYLPK